MTYDGTSLFIIVDNPMQMLALIQIYSKLLDGLPRG